MFRILLVFFATVQIISAQENPVFSKGEKSANVHHTGNVWLNELSAPDSSVQLSIALATFDPGARLDWHAHPGGQVLLFTEGIGYYQERGKPKQVVKKGQVIQCKPDVEHWHGATAEHGVAYIAASPTQRGRTKWLEKVNDVDYFSRSDAHAGKTENELINLSKAKWRWMQEFNTDSLAALFHDDAVFVHMGATFGKQQELDVIKSKGIVYKHAEIQEVSVRILGNTAILLNKVRLTAIVGGNEVVNPFNVTEVYVSFAGRWQLASLSFTRLTLPN